MISISSGIVVLECVFRDFRLIAFEESELVTFRRPPHGEIGAENLVDGQVQSLASTGKNGQGREDLTHLLLVDPIRNTIHHCITSIRCESDALWYLAPIHVIDSIRRNDIDVILLDVGNGM